MDILHMTQSFLAEVGKFLIFSVGVGYILRKWVGDQLLKLFNVWANKTERGIAISMHYKHQFDGEGHGSKDVLDCHQDRCRIFNTYA